MPKTATVPDLVEAGLSLSFAQHVLAGTRNCSWPVALWLFDQHDLVVPQMAGKATREIAALRHVFDPAPPSPKFKEAALARSSRKRKAA